MTEEEWLVRAVVEGAIGFCQGGGRGRGDDESGGRDGDDSEGSAVPQRPVRGHRLLW